MLVTGVAVAHWQDERASAAADTAIGAGDVLESNVEAAKPHLSSPDSLAETPAPPSPSSPSSPSSSEPSSASSTGIPVPASGPGTFTTAQADGTAVGAGSRVRRYKIMIEDGIDITASAAAAEVAAVLADPRGWSQDGVNSFRLVSSGSYDFVVKIATPDTVDRICGAAGLMTRGEVNCSVGPGQPAPAMMQQIKGLHGCVANAWPYNCDGTYLGGPSVP